MIRVASLSTPSAVRWKGVLVISVAVAVAAGTVGIRPALAEDSLGSPIASEALTDIRGGDISDSFNETNSASSSQGTSANNEGNSISAGGGVASGNFTIQAGGLSNNHGMTNNVVNTAPQSNVQGIMSLNLVLH